MNSYIAPEKNNHKAWIFFLFLQENTGCEDLLEVPLQGTANE